MMNSKKSSVEFQVIAIDIASVVWIESTKSKKAIHESFFVENTNEVVLKLIDISISFDA